MFGQTYNKSFGVNSLEKINVNNSDQWVLTRGRSVDLPLLIHVQGGPGLPAIPEAAALNSLLHLEDNFLVAYWDQRGCGKSFNRNIDSRTLTLRQLADDIAACTRYLLDKYNKKHAILAGYSNGATLSLVSASEYNHLYERLFLVGIDIDIQEANRFAFQHGLQKARNMQNKKAEKIMLQFEHDPVTDIKAFQTRIKVLSNLGVIKVDSTYNKLFFETVRNMLACREYSLPEIIRSIHGITFCQKALLHEMADINLSRQVMETKVPVHFIHGRLDGLSSCETVEKYFNHLKAGEKTFTVFEKSAHMPHYDEPRKFAELICRICGI